MPFDCYKLVTFPAIGDVFCCSKTCADTLFSESAETRYSLTPTVKICEGYDELLKGFFKVDDKQHSELMTTVYFSVCQLQQDTTTTSLYSSLSSGLKFIQLSHRCIYKPLFIEYAIDDDFNAIEVLNPVNENRSFTSEEMKCIMNEVHQMVVRVGIPYLFTQTHIMNK